MKCILHHFKGLFNPCRWWWTLGSSAHHHCFFFLQAYIHAIYIIYTTPAGLFFSRACKTREPLKVLFWKSYWWANIFTTTKKGMLMRGHCTCSTYSPVEGTDFFLVKPFLSRVHRHFQCVAYILVSLACLTLRNISRNGPPLCFHLNEFKLLL